jgi:predicted XRE-type DNA-binding protein
MALLAYDNSFNVTSELSENAVLDKMRSDLIFEIHKYVDFDSIPLKHIANRLGVTLSTIKALAKRDVEVFNAFELETFLDRIVKHN